MSLMKEKYLLTETFIQRCWKKCTEFMMEMHKNEWKVQYVKKDYEDLSTKKKICKKEYNDKHKEKIKEYSRNCYHSGNQKAKAKEYHEKKLPEYAKMYYRNLSETRK